MKGSMLAQAPEHLSEELVEVLCATEGVRIERIITRGQVSPEGFWYDQDQDEFVLLVQGSAELKLEGQENAVHLNTGDYLLLRAHQRHRVVWVDEQQDVIWLAVHFKSDSTVI